MKLIIPIVIFLFNQVLAENAEFNIQICRFPAVISIYTLIGEKYEIFKKHGIKAEIHEAAHGKICQDELLAKRSNFTIIGDGPYVYLSANKHDLKILAVTDVGHGVSIIGRKDLGVTSNLDSLKQKKLAYLPGTISGIFVYDFLERNKWTLNDLKLIALQPAAMSPALNGKQIDGFILWDPWITNAAVDLGANASIISGSVYEHRSLLLTHADLINEKPKLIAKTVSAFSEVSDYVKKNLDQVIIDLAIYMKLEPEVVKGIVAKYQFTFNLPSDLTTHLQNVMQLLTKYNQEFKDRKIENIDNLIDSRFILNKNVKKF